MKHSKLLDEFKTFISRGNVVDMAVGVIIGGAFKAIVDSLTADLIMPLLGIILNKIDFAGLQLTVGDAVLTYGNFIQTVINFLIMSVVIFFMLKGINLFHKKKEEAPPPPPQPTKEELLLTEIRDLLKESSDRQDS